MTEAEKLRFLAEDLINLAEGVGEAEDMEDGPCDAEVLCRSAICQAAGCVKDKADRARAILCALETSHDQ